MTHRYIGTKEILAWPQDKKTIADPHGEIDTPGYAVKYEDGYTSWSPKAAFEAAYRVCEGDGQALTFGDALYFLKLGKKVARAGWNGKGMWLILASNWNANLGAVVGTPNASPVDLPQDWAGYDNFIAMFTAGKTLIPWLASQADMLANDWQVLA